MINLFLRTKHWQLFFLLFVIPMIFQFITIEAIFSKVLKGSNPDLGFMFSYFAILPVLMILLMGVFFGWMWSVAVGIGKIIPEDLKLNIGRFKIFFFFPFVYMLFFIFFISSTMTGIFDDGTTPFFNYFVFIIPLHIFAMFCNFYCFFCKND